MTLHLVLLLALVPADAAQPADDEPYLPGLLATLRDTKGNTAVRVEPQLAFHAAGAADARLTAGGLEARWHGNLLVQVRGEYRFYLFGTGEASLQVAGKTVFAQQALRDTWADAPALPLDADFLPVELTLKQTGLEARIQVFWSGPGFGLEPIPPRLLYHPRERAEKGEFERGQLLTRTLRCTRCHGGDSPAPGPALNRLAGQVSRAWLIAWLTTSEHGKPQTADTASPRRMPAFGLSRDQAEAVADLLLHRDAQATPVVPEPSPPKPASPAKASKKAKGDPPPKPNAKAGERLFLTTGCIACHTWRHLGASGWLGGGDLTHVADKRPPEFFAQWLADPARLNADHRMPIFTLSGDERIALALFLAEQKSAAGKRDFVAQANTARRVEGGKLVEQFHCAACHRMPGKAPAPHAAAASTLTAASAWEHSCLGEPDATRQRPGYRLAPADAKAIRTFYAKRQPGPTAVPAALVLAEWNCLACHTREGVREATPLVAPLLSDKLAAVASQYPDLAAQVPGMTPPTLTSVGDKLTDAALAQAIARSGPAHRPYLHARMPQFPLSADALQTLLRYFVAVDRVPDRFPAALPPERSQQERYKLAGGRLVGSDGFGCTSCHQVGSVQPAQAQLNARGPNLSQLDQRIRRGWYERWVRNPVRIVPRMEMPSVQIPVSGVLGDRLDEQIAAVWHVLNQPGFEPPLPNPVRVLRHHGHDMAAEPIVLTDVLERRGAPHLVKPFLIGLSNRHNVLLDLETARIALWTVGDTARQRTRGKTWFWEPGGMPLLAPISAEHDVTLVSPDLEWTPDPRGQFVTEADGWSFQGPAVSLRYTLSFLDPGDKNPNPTARRRHHVRIVRTFSPLPAAGFSSGFIQEFTAEGLPAQLRLKVLLSAKLAATIARSQDRRTLHLHDSFSTEIHLREPAAAAFTGDANGVLHSVLLTPDAAGKARTVLHYRTAVPVDRLPNLPAVLAEVRQAEPVEVAPGFNAERLPLPSDIMPTALSWRPTGRLVFTSLKGQILEVEESAGQPRLSLHADGLPAPYGVFAGTDFIDVCVKYALLRIHKDRSVQTLASGWGYTHDYHDWAVGLPRSPRGEYHLGIPCQQDKRSEAAARFHGNVLRLRPRMPTLEDGRLFSLEPISAGHRFPMGLALDRRGELFVTDNQGNYNPFNELNHVRPGIHFGFINALDKGKAVPPLEPPAINIPHPWTRSVNGICFLDTPPEMRQQRGCDAFGPFEGHLVGCEYDTRRLIRMSLQRVGDTFQGAAYPLSVPPSDPTRGFLGPVVCAVSPRGELYVGSIRDSGWGAGNNVGEIVRVRLDPEQLPCGIAELRATRTGFEIDFCQPVDPARAARRENYTVQSYRREATPAYGGPDLERRTEKVSSVRVFHDARRVTLELPALRTGFVYEFRLKNLAPHGGPFHPDEAHYTLRARPG